MRVVAASWWISTRSWFHCRLDGSCRRQSCPVRLLYRRSSHCSAESKLFQFAHFGIRVGRGAMTERIESRRSRVSGPLPSPSRSEQARAHLSLITQHLLHPFHVIVVVSRCLRRALARYFSCPSERCMLEILFPSLFGICKDKHGPINPLITPPSADYARSRYLTTRCSCIRWIACMPDMMPKLTCHQLSVSDWPSSWHM